MSRFFMIRQLPSAATTVVAVSSSTNSGVAMLQGSMTRISIRALATTPTNGGSATPAQPKNAKRGNVVGAASTAEAKKSVTQASTKSAPLSMPRPSQVTSGLSSTTQKSSSFNWSTALRNAVSSDATVDSASKDRSKTQVIEYFKTLPANALQATQTKDLARSLLSVLFTPPPPNSSWQPVVEGLLKEMLTRGNLVKGVADESLFGKNFSKFLRLGKKWATAETWSSFRGRIMQDLQTDPTLLTPQVAIAVLRYGDKPLRDVLMNEASVEALIANRQRWEAVSAEDATDIFYALALGAPQPSLNKAMTELLELTAKKLEQATAQSQGDHALISRSFLKLRHAKGLRESKLPGWTTSTSVDALRGKIALKFDSSKYSDYDCHVATAVLAAGGRKFAIARGSSDGKFLHDLCNEFETRPSLLNKPLKLLANNLTNFCVMSKLYDVPDPQFLVRFSDRLIDASVSNAEQVKTDLFLIEQLLNDFCRVASLFPDTHPRTDKFIDAVVFPALGINSTEKGVIDSKVSTDRLVRLANYMLYRTNNVQRERLFGTVIATLDARHDMQTLALRGFLSLGRFFSFANQKLALKSPEYPAVKTKLFESFVEAFPKLDARSDPSVVVRLAKTFSFLSGPNNVQSAPLKIIGEFVGSNVASFTAADLAQLSSELTGPSEAAVATELSRRGFAQCASFDEKVKLASVLASSLSTSTVGHMEQQKAINSNSVLLEEFRNKELPQVMVPESKLRTLGTETLNQLSKLAASLEWRYEFAAMADEVVRRVSESPSSLPQPSSSSMNVDGEQEGEDYQASSSEQINLYTIVYQMQLLTEDEEDLLVDGEADVDKLGDIRKRKESFFGKVARLVESSAQRLDTTILLHIASVGDAKIRARSVDIALERIDKQKELEAKPRLAFTVFPHVLHRQSSFSSTTPSDALLVNKLVDSMTRSLASRGTVHIPSRLLVRALVQLRKLRSSALDIPKQKETELIRLLSEELVGRVDEIPTDELMTVVGVLESFHIPETRKREEELIRKVWQNRKDLSLEKRFELLRVVEEPHDRAKVVELILNEGDVTRSSWMLLGEEDYAKIVRSLNRTSGQIPRMDELVDWISRVGSRLAPNAEMDVLIRAAKLVALHHVKSNVLGLTATSSPPTSSSSRASDAQLQFFESVAEQVATRKDLAVPSDPIDDLPATSTASSSSGVDLWVDLIAAMARIHFVSRPEALQVAVNEVNKLMSSSNRPDIQRSVVTLAQSIIQADVLAASMSSSPLFDSIRRLSETIRAQVKKNESAYQAEDLQVVSKMLDSYLDPSKKDGSSGWF